MWWWLGLSTVIEILCADIPDFLTLHKYLVDCVLVYPYSDFLGIHPHFLLLTFIFSTSQSWFLHLNFFLSISQSGIISTSPVLQAIPCIPRSYPLAVGTPQSSSHSPVSPLDLLQPWFEEGSNVVVVHFSTHKFIPPLNRCRCICITFMTIPLLAV